MKKLFIAVLACVAIAFVATAIVNKPVTSTARIQVMTGTGVTATDGTVTNTFGTSFSSVPTIVACQFGPVVSNTNSVTSITTSNFIYTSAKAAVSNQWVAIGAP